MDTVVIGLDDSQTWRMFGSTWSVGTVDRGSGKKIAFLLKSGRFWTPVKEWNTVEEASRYFETEVVESEEKTHKERLQQFAEIARAFREEVK